MWKKLIAIDASPNTQTEDLQLTLRLITSPLNWQKDEKIVELEKYFTDKYGAILSRATNSGRAALTLLLSSIISSGDGVVLQAFTCLAVPNAIGWAGGKCVFVDIDKNTYNMNPDDLRRKISKHTKAVIVQHTFGIPAQIDEIKSICDEHNLILIEDCAHAMGVMYKDKLVGTIGDGAIFSFNQDKVVSGVSGGMLIINNKKIADKFKEKNFVLKKQSIIEILKILLYPLLWFIIIPLYEKFSIGKGITYIAWKLGIISNAISKEEEEGKVPKKITQSISNPQAELVLQSVKRIEKDNKRRIDIAVKYRHELSQIVVHPEQTNNTMPIYLRYPIQVHNPEKLIESARSWGIILGKWYDKPVFPWIPISEKYYQLGSCPVAEATGKAVVNLPTFPKLTDSDVSKIIDVVKQTYG